MRKDVPRTDLQKYIYSKRKECVARYKIELDVWDERREGGESWTCEYYLEFGMRYMQHIVRKSCILLSNGWPAV